MAEAQVISSFSLGFFSKQKRNGRDLGNLNEMAGGRSGGSLPLPRRSSRGPGTLLSIAGDVYTFPQTVEDLEVWEKLPSAGQGLRRGLLQ